MASLFDSLLGREEKKAGKSPQSLSPTAQKYDQEYIDYCIELEQTVSSLEVYLYTSDDPKEIATETLKTAYRFYGGNWTGILDINLNLDVRSQLWWVNMTSHHNDVMLIQEFEIAEHMTN